MRKKIFNLIKELETYGFECQGGPLKHAMPWEKLKREITKLDKFYTGNDLICQAKKGCQRNKT